LWLRRNNDFTKRCNREIEAVNANLVNYNHKTHIHQKQGALNVLQTSKSKDSCKKGNSISKPFELMKEYKEIEVNTPEMLIPQERKA
jgi:hypothetical protein